MTQIKLVLALIVLALTGCSGSLEVARKDGIAARAGAPQITAGAEDRTSCEKLDRRRARWTAVAAGLATLSGGSGLVSIPVDDEDARVALIAGSVGALALAGSAEVLAAQASQSWARHCSASP